MRKAVITLLLLLFAFGGIVSAQGTLPTAFCGDLAEADCALLQGASTAMMGLESVNYTLDADLTVTEIPDMEEPVTITLAGQGSYGGDAEQMAPLMQMSSPENMGAMFENLEELPALFESALRAISFQGSFTLTLPEALLAQAAAASDTEFPSAVPFEIRMVDGFFYINADEFTSQLDEEMAAGIPTGWQGLDVAGFYRETLERSFAMMEPGTMPGFDPEAFQQYMHTLSDPEFLGRFMSIERGADEELNGQTMAVFTTTINYGALFSDPSIFQNMMGQMGMEGQEEEVSAMTQAMGAMFADFVIEVTQHVGQDDNYLHRSEVNVDWDINLGPMAAAFSESMGETATAEATEEAPSPHLTFNFVIELTDFNSGAEVVEPEDATVYPLEMLLPPVMATEEATEEASSG